MKKENKVTNQKIIQNILLFYLLFQELKKLRDEMLTNKRAVTPAFSKTAQSFMSWSGDIKDEVL